MTDNEVAKLKERIDSLRRELILRSETQDKALQIQAREYERRLETLNHEASQLKAMQSTYVPRETYEMSQREVLAKYEELKTYKDTMTGKASQTQVIVAYVISFIGVVIAVAGFFIGG